MSQAPDLWLAPDKVQHFVFCAICTATGFFACVHFFQRKKCWQWRWRFAAGAFLGLAAGALKEIGDGLHWWPGNVSLRDMGADLVGTAVATLTGQRWLTLARTPTTGLLQPPAYQP